MNRSFLGLQCESVFALNDGTDDVPRFHPVPHVHAQQFRVSRSANQNSLRAAKHSRHRSQMFCVESFYVNLLHCHVGLSVYLYYHNPTSVVKIFLEHVKCLAHERVYKHCKIHFVF